MPHLVNTVLGLLQAYPCKLVTDEAITKGLTQLSDEWALRELAVTDAVISQH